MAALCARGRPRLGPLHWLSAILVLVAFEAPPTMADPAPVEPIVVFLDQAKMLQLPERATTVVVGNPLIADLSIQPGGLAVITGKGYGATNFIVTDKTGTVLLEKIVEVEEPSDKTVVVYSGQTRQTYSCTPECSPRITLGDTGAKEFDKDTQHWNDFFGSAIGQVTTRNTQATGAGAMASGH